MCRILLVALVVTLPPLLCFAVMALGNSAAALCEWSGFAKPTDPSGRTLDDAERR